MNRITTAVTRFTEAWARRPILGVPVRLYRATTEAEAAIFVCIVMMFHIPIIGVLVSLYFLHIGSKNLCKKEIPELKILWEKTIDWFYTHFLFNPDQQREYFRRKEEDVVIAELENQFN